MCWKWDGMGWSGLNLKNFGPPFSFHRASRFKRTASKNHSTRMASVPKILRSRDVKIELSAASCYEDNICLLIFGSACYITFNRTMQNWLTCNFADPQIYLSNPYSTWTVLWPMHFFELPDLKTFLFWLMRYWKNSNLYTYIYTAGKFVQL